MDNHIRTLENLLSALNKINITKEDRVEVAEALKAAIEALQAKQPSESTGLNLSHDAATDHLLRLSQGLPTAKEEDDARGINQLVGLVNNHPVANTDDDDAANFLAKLSEREA